MVDVAEGPLVGIFVGGHSRRMGRPKGLLMAPTGEGQTLIERLQQEVLLACPRAEVVLVGCRDEYSHIALEQLPDAAPDAGPLGGLVSLLSLGAEQGRPAVVALACDFPFLTSSLIARLVRESPQADIVCPYLDGRFQPLAARYSTHCLEAFRGALATGHRSLQPLVGAARTECLQLSIDEELALGDWDTPQDAGIPI
jgi:molybdopterin-guanine dinucleotide biosynthesis protein A